MSLLNPRGLSGAAAPCACRTSVVQYARHGRCHSPSPARSPSSIARRAAGPVLPALRPRGRTGGPWRRPKDRRRWACGKHRRCRGLGDGPSATVRAWPAGRRLDRGAPFTRNSPHGPLPARDFGTTLWVSMSASSSSRSTMSPTACARDHRGVGDGLGRRGLDFNLMIRCCQGRWSNFLAAGP